MKQSFTLNQCLRMLYGETTPEESFMLSEIIDHNDTLHSKFVTLKEAMQSLDEVAFEPAATSVQNILRYNSDKALEVSL